MKKHIFKLLVFSVMLSSCTGNSAATPVSKNENQIFSFSEKGFEIKADEPVICTINYDNGIKLFSIRYPFENNLLAGEYEGDEPLFADFDIMIKNSEQEVITLSFHDGHYVTYNDMTISISKIPFSSSVMYNDEEKKAILTGADMPLSLWIPDEYTTVQLLYQNSTVTIKDKALIEEVINLYKEQKASPSDGLNVEKISFWWENMGIVPVTLLISGEKGAVYFTNYLDGGLIINDEGFEYNRTNHESKVFIEDEIIINFAIELLASALIEYDEGADGKAYLSPLSYSAETFSLDSSPMFPDRILGKYESFVNYKLMGLTAYENDQLINELPTDTGVHVIQFYDKDDNIYQYAYKIEK